jgi:hypothetical protein
MSVLANVVGLALFAFAALGVAVGGFWLLQRYF